MAGIDGIDEVGEVKQMIRKLSRRTERGGGFSWLVVLAVLLAVLLMGFVSSFFSDWLGGVQSSTVGVAELREGGFSLTHYSEGDADGELVFAENKTTNYVKDDGSIDADGVLEDFNPGDSLEVSFDVGNAGAKSVWYRTLLTVTVRMA
ncbi:MAG: hypothetical protein ABF489_07780, partial [Bifidobacterium sp.]|uniref:hypothetical protein n=1 Tax=Bifidobacterium sp. TaxID=41200 RepID=UPI0039E78E0E